MWIIRVILPLPAGAGPRQKTPAVATITQDRATQASEIYAPHLSSMPAAQQHAHVLPFQVLPRSRWLMIAAVSEATLRECSWRRVPLLDEGVQRVS